MVRSFSKELEFQISHASIGDLDLLAAQRQKMWLDIHIDTEAKVEATADLTREWIRAKLPEGKLVGFIAKTDAGIVAGSGCVWVREEVPRPTSPRLAVPYLMSMYTEREFRRKGVAKLILEAAIRWCRDNGYERILSHASDEGRTLYEAYGFRASREMRLNS